MALVFRPYFADPDRLLLGGHVLSALEAGKMRMHPADYTEISAWMRDQLETLPAPVLFRLRDEGPSALRAVAENALYDRGELAWAEDRILGALAQFEFGELMARIRQMPQT